MYEMTVGKTTFTVLAQASQNDLAYEWHEARLLKDEEGNLFSLSGSGCSCNWLGDDETEEDLVSIKSASEAVELAKEEFSPEDVYDFASQAMQY